jgi:signal transduction histidine kinase
MLQLAPFIRENTEQILSEWESFARTLPMAEPMDVAALRDHAKEMLGVIARDLETPQTLREETAKAKGNAVTDGRTGPTAAQEHGAGRAESGFTVSQMVSEFRALRASVVRLWSRQVRDVDASQLQELTRFHEAIDQAIAESVVRFSEEIKQSKERFLAILGHDLRTPLGAIITSSAFLLESGELEDPALTLVRGIGASSRRMNQMVMDLLDFARTRFGDRIPIVREETDMQKVVRDVVAEVTASSPDRTVAIETSGDLRGRWDANRLAQMLTNLVGNAVEHGAADAPITVAARGAEREVVLSVHSNGPAIPKNEMRQIFDAMKHGTQNVARDRRHLGLGLYIVDKIVAAHGGSVDVRSSKEQGTTFTVHLPRDGETPPVRLSHGV